MSTVKRTRDINSARILKAIWQHSGISRVEIARKVNLDKSTVTNQVSEMIELGLIEEVEQGVASRKGGRKPISLEINKNFGFIIGLELQPESYTAVAVNLAGETMGSMKGSSSKKEPDIAALAIAAIQGAKEGFKHLGRRLIGIGLGVSGLVDAKNGTILFSIPMRINRSINLVTSLGGKFPVPIFVENDANCCAWGELAFHKQQDLRDFIFALIEFRPLDSSQPDSGGLGIGLGIVIDGKVHYGKDSTAGEFRSVLWRKGTQAQISLDPALIANMTKNRGVMEEFGRELGANLAAFVNTFNLSHVFLGGDIERYDVDFIGILREEIRKNWMYPLDPNVTIKYSSAGDKAVAYGAAGMLLDRLITSKMFPITALMGGQNMSDSERVSRTISSMLA